MVNGSRERSGKPHFRILYKLDLKCRYGWSVSDWTTEDSDLDSLDSEVLAEVTRPNNSRSTKVKVTKASTLPVNDGQGFGYERHWSVPRANEQVHVRQIPVEWSSEEEQLWRKVERSKPSRYTELLSLRDRERTVLLSTVAKQPKTDYRSLSLERLVETAVDEREDDVTPKRSTRDRKAEPRGLSRVMQQRAMSLDPNRKPSAVVIASSEEGLPVSTHRLVGYYDDTALMFTCVDQER